MNVMISVRKLPPLIRSYQTVEAEFVRHTERLGLSASVFATLGGYSLLMAQSGTGPDQDPTRPSLLISAGIHGDEPAGVRGVLEWLDRDAQHWLNRINVTIFPCLNPYGYERNRREGFDGLDANRTFRLPNAPLPKALRPVLADRQFRLAIDLHEDIDFSSFYVYEAKENPPYLAPRLVGRMSARAQLSDGDSIEDILDSVTRGGIIRVPRLNPYVLPQWPLGRYLFTFHTHHVLCPESPGHLALGTRASIHTDALNEACAFVASGCDPMRACDGR